MTGEVTLVVLGKLADLLPAPRLQLPAPLDWAGLLAALPADLADALRQPKVRLAINGELLADKAALAAFGGDEVAALPPVSGG